MARKTIILLYGGESPEHEVSIRSAHNIYAALDNEKYDVHPVFIDKFGKWWHTPRIDGGHIGCPQLIPVLGQRQFITLPGERTLRADVLFPVLHGSNGEDGAVQGVAQMLHVPCVGPNVTGAAITIDKDVTKRLLQSVGIPVVPWVTWDKLSKPLVYNEVTEKLGTALFVKPNTAGSSLGVTKVESDIQFQDALKSAGNYSRHVIIEKAVHAQEVELAAAGVGQVYISMPGEIAPGEKFYSYDDKYSASSTATLNIPANLDDETIIKIQDYAKLAYETTRSAGMARVDFFVEHETNDIYCNEINSIPGFTTISMYPKLWHAEGKKYPQLIDELVSYALDEYNIRNSVNHGG